MKKKLVNDNENSTKQYNDTPISNECQCIYHHDWFKLVNLKEEDNDIYLNKNQIMNSITCSKCRLPLVKDYKYEPNKKLITLFNTKRAALCCNELLTSRLVVCHFYIFHNCKSTSFQNNKDKSKGSSSRGRWQIN